MKKESSKGKTKVGLMSEGTLSLHNLEPVRIVGLEELSEDAYIRITKGKQRIKSDFIIAGLLERVITKRRKDNLWGNEISKEDKKQLKINQKVLSKAIDNNVILDSKKFIAKFNLFKVDQMDAVFNRVSDLSDGLFYLVISLQAKKNGGTVSYTKTEEPEICYVETNEEGKIEYDSKTKKYTGKCIYENSDEFKSIPSNADVYTIDGKIFLKRQTSAKKSQSVKVPEFEYVAELWA